ncbi:LytR/AlgR family response regulator transcription factor [Ekhidna sp.]|uniref:LytR/AlgR family response regulator transcription factor n=1 Tax=Ekhidna sp. TaxID=2608089 RepID=UPI00351389EE
MITCIAIDDDPLFLQSLKAYFWEYEGIELIGTFQNPVNGIMKVVKEKPDVLLLDLEMPYLDGFEALESMDKKPKVIMISAHVNQPSKAKQIQIDKYIRKVQLDKDLLKRTILEIVEAKPIS